jgi:hypothetical protein
VVAVGGQCGAGEVAARAQADPRGDLVTGEADRAGQRERAEVVDGLWVDEAADRFGGRDAGADEDRRDDDVAGSLLGLERAQQERRPERDGGQRVAEVVDQVGEQRDA